MPRTKLLYASHWPLYHFVNQRAAGDKTLMKKDKAATHVPPLREPLALVPFASKECNAETGCSYFGACY